MRGQCFAHPCFGLRRENVPDSLQSGLQTGLCLQEGKLAMRRGRVALILKRILPEAAASRRNATAMCLTGGWQISTTGPTAQPWLAAGDFEGGKKDKQKEI